MVEKKKTEKEDKVKDKELIAIKKDSKEKIKDKSGGKEKDDKKETEEKNSKEESKETEEKDDDGEEEDEKDRKLVAGLEGEVSKTPVGQSVRGERNELDLTKDYNSRKINQEGREEGKSGFYEGRDKDRKLNIGYSEKDRFREESVDGTFYDSPHRVPRDEFYSSELRRPEKVIHDFNDLEKKSEENSFGNFGIARRRRTEEDRHYDELKYDAD